MGSPACVLVEDLPPRRRGDLGPFGLGSQTRWIAFRGPSTALGRERSVRSASAAVLRTKACETKPILFGPGERMPITPVRRGITILSPKVTICMLSANDCSNTDERGVTMRYLLASLLLTLARLGSSRCGNGDATVCHELAGQCVLRWSICRRCWMRRRARTGLSGSRMGIS